MRVSQPALAKTFHEKNLFLFEKLFTDLSATSVNGVISGLFVFLRLGLLSPYYVIMSPAVMDSGSKKSLAIFSIQKVSKQRRAKTVCSLNM